MNIIISPAKKMNVCNNDLTYKNIPSFIHSSKELFSYLSSLSYEELRKLLCCNDKLAELNFERYKSMDLSKNLSPAILTYEGIQYKYMGPGAFTYDEFEYAEKHLKILSGFYGVLKPFDGVVPYRLEMQAKISTGVFNNLYDFWGDRLYNEVIKDSRVIINLASLEYSKTIEKYITDEDKYITCIFGELKDGKIKVKATEAKMARGLMVRYLCENAIEDPEKIKNFTALGLTFSKEHSSENQFVFLK